MKYLLLVLFAIAGCNEIKKVCKFHCDPKDKQQSADFQLKCIQAGASGKNTLSGDDQDIEDVVDACRLSSQVTFCEWKCVVEE